MVIPVSIILILLVTFFAGLPALRVSKKKKVRFLSGQALACGVFLGAGLLHMLPNASLDFHHLSVAGPWAFLIAGFVFLLLLLIEHVLSELSHHQNAASQSIVVLTVIMLSVHSLLAGAALGLSQGVSATVLMLLAILGHKWAASFALAAQLADSRLSLRRQYIYFSVFVVMTPVGILLGRQLLFFQHTYPMLPAIFTAMAAGTFIFIGTLHGLARSPLIKSCCNLAQFSWMILGFGLMAVLAFV